MIRIWSFILLLACIVLLAGCGFKEIDNRFFVVAIGFDKPESGDKKYEITLKIAIPSDKPQYGKKNFQIISEQSDTVTGAISLLRSKVDKEFDFGHTKLLLVGESLAKSELKDVIDWMQRRREIQIISWMAIGSPDAKTILEVSPPSERYASNSLFLAFSGDGVESAYITREYLFTFYRERAEPGIDPILPIIEKEGQNYVIRKAAVFDHHMNKKLVLSREETRFLNMLRGQVNVYYYIVQVKGSDERFALYSSSFSAKPEVGRQSGGKPLLRVFIDMHSIVEEYFPHQTLSPDKIPMLEKEGERSFREETVKLVKKLQKNRVDPLGFGLIYRSHWWGRKVDDEEWLDLYQGMDIQAKTNVNIRSTGIFE